MKKIFLPLCLIAATPSVGMAQNNHTVIEEVTVSARKINENAQTVPISISALSDNNLKNQSIRNFNDVQAQVPNLFLQTHPSEPQALSLSIRGQRQNDILLTLDPSVGIYIDNLYYPRTMGLSGALIDVQRIEVLRGPQGTLYGRNTTGGAMSVFTQNPSDELASSLNLKAGNFGYTEAQGVVNIPLTDSLAMRLVAQKSDRDGYGEDRRGSDLQDEDNQYFRTKFHLEITPDAEASLWGSYQRNKNSGDIRKLAYIAPVPNLATLVGSISESITQQQAYKILNSYTEGDTYKTDGTYPNGSDFEGSTIGFDLSVNLTEELTFRSITGYQKLDRYNTQDGDGTPYEIVAAVRATDATYLSQEFQLLGENDSLNWVTGAYYGIEKGTEYNESIVLPGISAASPTIYEGDVENISYALFGQTNWQFLPTWRLTLGARYSWDERQLDANNSDTTGCLIPAPGALIANTNNPGQCPRRFADNYSDLSWLISVDHNLSDNIMMYGKVAYGYRTGGRNMRGTKTIESLAAFEPETVTEYEVGIKSEFYDRRLKVNAALYFDDYQDIQRSTSVSNSSGGISTRVDNAASGTIQGLELELNALLTDHWNVALGLGISNTQYDEFNALAADGVSIQDRSAESFGVPEKSANLSTRYTVSTGWGEMAAQLDYQWQDEYLTVPEVPTKTPLTQGDFGLLNARISFGVERWGTEIALYGKNLTDKEYIVGGGNAETSLGYTFIIPGEPRVFGIEILKRFGDI